MLATGFLCLPALAAAKPVDDSAPSSLAVPPVGSDTPRGSDDAASRPKATARYDDGRPPLIVMKGERHAGTNFLTGILETSLGDIRVTGGGSDPDPMTSCNPFAPEPPRTYCCWKHGYASTWCHGFQSPDAPVMRGGVVKSLPAHVFLIRSPYSWVLAMHDEPYDYNGILSANFSEFLRTPFSYVPRDYQGSSLADKPDSHANPIQLWNAKMRSYLQFEEAQRAICVHLTHEMLFDIDALKQRLGPLTKLAPQLQNASIRYPPFSQYQDKFSNNFSRHEFEEAKRYEKEKLWLDLMSQEDLDFINMELERNVVDQVGLEVVMKTTKEEEQEGSTEYKPWQHRLERSEHMRLLRLLDDSPHHWQNHRQKTASAGPSR